jgi:hypothetical protein
LAAFILRGVAGSSSGATAGGSAASTRKGARRARIPRGGRATA